MKYNNYISLFLYFLPFNIMRKINISFLLNNNTIPINTTTTNTSIDIETNFITFNISNYTIKSYIKKIHHIIRSYDDITSINITFDKNIKNEYTINNILTKLNDIIYQYHPKHPKISLHNVSSYSHDLMDELIKYKDIVMDPNKNPETYLKYVLSRIPKSYKANVFTISKDKKYKTFPLTKAVGAGSPFDAYFVHVQPKTVNKNKKHIYLVGKAVTFDSGGLNLKVGNSHIEDMKIDMIGSAIIISVLNLLSKHKYDTKYSIHLIIPIVENMINGDAIRPGMVVRSMSNRMIEIVNTDAEGRLCLADAIDYINIVLMKKFKSKNNLIIDIATLTGNTDSITGEVSGIIMGNSRSTRTDESGHKSEMYSKLFVETGEKVGEYLEFLTLRPEYGDFLKSNVADISNLTRTSAHSGCLMGGAFINYFVNPTIPWIHLDVASTTFINNLPTCYGINLLYDFIKNIKDYETS